MPEMQNIEWKEIWKDDYLAWICGFANAQGGTLYIGKNDTGKVTGISNSQKLLEDLPNKIRDALGIIIPVNLLIEDGKEYIIVYQLIVGKNHYGLLLSDDGEHPIIKIGTFYTHEDNTSFKVTNNREQALYILESILNQAQ